MKYDFNRNFIGSLTCMYRAASEVVLLLVNLRIAKRPY